MNKKLVKPLKLKPKDNIKLLAPSSDFDKKKFEETLTTLKSMDFKIHFNNGIFEKVRFFANNDTFRVREIEEAICTDFYSMILCVRGGYGASRLLPALLKKRIQPKIFCGFSDITALLNFFYQKYSLIGFHGPMLLSGFREDRVNTTKEEFTELFLNGNAQGVLNRYEMTFLNEGKAEGPLIGGNLSLLAHSLGTKFDIQTEGHLLFLEDVNEDPYRIDRMFLQLYLSGKFSKIKAILLGDFFDTKDELIEPSLIYESLKEFLPKNIPVLSGFPASHKARNTFIPIGIRAEIPGKKPILNYLESPFAD